MTTRMFFKEARRFLKENIKLISLFTIVGAFLFTIVLNYSFGTEDEELTESTYNSEIYDTDIRYAQFSIYVENVDGSAFVNTSLLEKIILSSEIISKVEGDISIDIRSILEEQVSNGFQPMGIDRGAIGIGRDPMSDTLVFKTKIGNEEQRLKTAQFYFDFFKNNEIELLKNKNVIILEEPHLHEYTSSEILEAQQKTAKIGEESSSLLLLIEIALSIIIGVALSVIVAALYHIYSKKISYAFNYYVPENYVMLIERTDADKFIYSVVEPSEGEKLVASQEELPFEIFDAKAAGKTMVTGTSSIIEADLSKKYSEVIIVVIEGKTEKDWYSNQLNFAKRLDTHVKVIQTSEKVIRSIEVK